jgi:hypothetical protein
MPLPFPLRGLGRWEAEDEQVWQEVEDEEFHFHS